MIRLRRSAAVLILTCLVTGGLVRAQVRDWPSEPPPRPLAPKEVSFPP